ncbi:MAG TPA: hypothetical protein VGB73_19365 [Pyrinomonadaceae bacterium]|jgi:hypothetical protein
MPKKQEKTNRRTQVKELPKQEQELSKDEQKKIKGGPLNSFFLPSINRSEGSGA